MARVFYFVFLVSCMGVVRGPNSHSAPTPDRTFRWHTTVISNLPPLEDGKERNMRAWSRLEHKKEGKKSFDVFLA